MTACGAGFLIKEGNAMFLMKGRNNIPFFSVLLALLLCIPLLCAGGTPAEAKAGMSPNAGALAAVSKPAAEDQTDRALKAAGLVDLRMIGCNFDIDMRYAGADNFTGAPIYHQAKCYLRKETAGKLAAASRQFNAMGYRIRIFDAYRPYSVQLYLYQKTPEWLRPSLFIADPYHGGSNHNRGAAIDMTLDYYDGSPVEMPTDFDSFSASAGIHYGRLSPSVIQNREMLASVMVRNGFRRINNEWWHFDDTDAGSYPLLDIAI